MITNNLVGRQFGLWTVIVFSGKNKHGNAMWKCRCECGKEASIQGGNLVSGNTRGCLPCHHKSQIKGTSARTQVLNMYKSNAKTRNREWSLTDEQFFNLSQQPCHYCKAVQSKEMKKPYDTFKYNGIDRKDNSKGYTFENSLPCCHECNMRRGTLSYEKFLDWIERITKAHTMRAAAGGSQ